MKQYIMIPRGIIENKSLGNKRVIVYASIFFSGLHPGRVKDLAEYSRFSTCRGQASAVGQYRAAISSLYSLGYLDDTGDGFYIKPQEGFGVVYYQEFLDILSERDRMAEAGKRMNHANAVLLLAYIRSRLIKRDGLPEFYSDLLRRISDVTGLSTRSISAGLDVLERLNIIHHEELPRYQTRNGLWHSNVTIFVNKRNPSQPGSTLDWEKETGDAIRHIMNHIKDLRRNNHLEFN